MSLLVKAVILLPNNGIFALEISLIGRISLILIDDIDPFIGINISEALFSSKMSIIFEILSFSFIIRGDSVKSIIFYYENL